MTRPDHVPRPWRWLARGFRWYTVRHVRKHLHALRLSRSGSPIPLGEGPLIIAMNHPSWWDPLIGIVLAGQFPGYEHAAAIDAVALQKYPIFKRLGFLPVDASGPRGVSTFLAAAHAWLLRPDHAFWVTPQGRFADVRERPLGLRPGIGYLAARNRSALVLPVAVEYAFWTESAPEALVRIGEPLRARDHPDLDGREWTAAIEAAMVGNMDALALEAASRKPDGFVTLLEGRTGVGGIYDMWRRAKAWVRGRGFDSSHGVEGRP